MESFNITGTKFEQNKTISVKLILCPNYKDQISNLTFYLLFESEYS